MSLTPNATENQLSVGLDAPSRWLKLLPLVRCSSLERDVSTQMSSSALDGGLKLRGSTQYSLTLSLYLNILLDDALQKRILFLTFKKRIADVNAATQISLCENMGNPYIELRG
ncbi:hypothetical protein TNCV_2433141 [Trichonephila clavipes]|nr:hypothetical protein TNCV_2433141 [Trichonephila clavipes]